MSRKSVIRSVATVVSITRSVTLVGDAQESSPSSPDALHERLDGARTELKNLQSRVAAMTTVGPGVC